MVLRITTIRQRVTGEWATRRRARGAPPETVPCGYRRAPVTGHRASPHPRPHLGAAGASERTRGRCVGGGSGSVCVDPSHPPRAGLGHAVRRVGARQIVECTPGRHGVRPGVRWTPAGTGLPRPRWLNMLGDHDPRGPWLTPQTCPSWLTREALAAWPEAFRLREGRSHFGRPEFRVRQMTLVTTRLEAEVYRVADRADLDRQR